MQGTLVRVLVVRIWWFAEEESFFEFGFDDLR
jgi:hypothetical protein